DRRSAALARRRGRLRRRGGRGRGVGRARVRRGGARARVAAHAARAPDVGEAAPRAVQGAARSFSRGCPPPERARQGREAGGGEAVSERVWSQPLTPRSLPLCHDGVGVSRDLPVTRAGIEPATYGLKVRCSTN